MSERCNQHFGIFFGTCGFFVFCFAILTGHVIANEQRNTDSLKIHTKENSAEMSGMVERMDKGFMDVAQRLARIEGKLDRGRSEDK